MKYNTMQLLRSAILALLLSSTLTEAHAVTDEYPAAQQLYRQGRKDDALERLRAVLDANPRDLHAYLKTIDRPLNRLNEKDLCPGSKALESINDEYR